MIALDAMGGDFAPGVVVEGALDAYEEYGIKTILVGNEDEIRRILPSGSAASQLQIVKSEEFVEMHEVPSESFFAKPSSSIRTGIQLVKEEKAEAFISAGNTGAVMFAAYKILGTIKDVSRPAIICSIPTPRGNSFLLDCGATAESKSQWLKQFAIMGHIYCTRFQGMNNPSTGLLNNGSEKSKGIRSLQDAYEMLGAEKEINFKGFVEPKDILSGSVDIAVTDGFSGNIFLKTIEAWATTFIEMYAQNQSKSLKNKLFSFFSKNSIDEVLDKLVVSSYGGSPLLGINGLCVICHGESNATSIKNAIRITNDYVSRDFINVISGETSRISSAGKKRDVPKKNGLRRIWKSIFREKK